MKRHPYKRSRRMFALELVEARIEHLEDPDGPWWRGSTMAKLTKEERDTKLAIHRRDLENLRRKI